MQSTRKSLKSFLQVKSQCLGILFRLNFSFISSIKIKNKIIAKIKLKIYQNGCVIISPLHTFMNIPALQLKNTLCFLIMAGIFTKV